MSESYSNLPHPEGALTGVQDTSWIVQSSSVGTPTRQVYEPLQRAFDYFNGQLFDGRIPRCLLTIQRNGARVYGYYSPHRFVGRAAQTCDEIAMNPMYFSARPKTEVLATMVHEMVHAWQQHFGKPGRGRYHNAEWAAKMKSVGLYPSSTGVPGGAETGDSMSHYIVAGGRYGAAVHAPALDDLVLEWSEDVGAQRTVVAPGELTSAGPSGPGTSPYGRTNRVRRHRGEVHPDLHDGTRAMEVAEGVARSLRRGRTVELHYEEISEAGTFKSVMTSFGCLILVAILCILPIALAGPVLGIGWTIYIAYIIPPALIGFVLLQLFRFALRDPRKSSADS